jgi:hypothetical protein
MQLEKCIDVVVVVVIVCCCCLLATDAHECAIKIGWGGMWIVKIVLQHSPSDKPSELILVSDRKTLKHKI